MSSKRKKILVVAMSDSIHTVRWIRQIQDQDWEIFLFPSSYGSDLHSNLKGIKLCIPLGAFREFIAAVNGEKLYSIFRNFARSLIIRFFPEYRSWLLNWYIKLVQPDVIHSLETQGAGYLVSDTKNLYLKNRSFPPWWHTNWGSDIFLFGHIPFHRPKIEMVLASCDYYSCECERDIKLAREYGFTGEFFPVYPNTGGFDLYMVQSMRKHSQVTSQRKLIMLKGYQGWAGRALVGLRALERCADLLKEYTIIIYSNPSAEDIFIAATLFTARTNIKINILPAGTSHEEILSYHSRARVSIGLSISDAISTSLLEAMAMGSFPIQSSTACACEWIIDGETGYIVPSEDPEIIEEAIKQALCNDELVNSAAEKNFDKIMVDADYNKLKDLTIKSYRKIFDINKK